MTVCIYSSKAVGVYLDHDHENYETDYKDPAWLSLINEQNFDD